MEGGGNLVELVPFRGPASAHRGYLDVARYLHAELGDLIRDSDLPVIVTGHSLGGSVALLLAMMLADEGQPVRVITYAPAPIVDGRTADDYTGLLRADNFFLPNEELAGLSGDNRWLRLPGQRRSLPAVGKTAGAAHFVINYLKAQLVAHGLDRQTWASGLPDCVLNRTGCAVS